MGGVQSSGLGGGSPPGRTFPPESSAGPLNQAPLNKARPRPGPRTERKTKKKGKPKPHNMHIVEKAYMPLARSVGSVTQSSVYFQTPDTTLRGE